MQFTDVTEIGDNLIKLRCLERGDTFLVDQEILTKLDGNIAARLGMAGATIAYGLDTIVRRVEIVNVDYRRI